MLYNNIPVWECITIVIKCGLIFVKPLTLVITYAVVNQVCDLESQILRMPHAHFWVRRKIIFFVQLFAVLFMCSCSVACGILYTSNVCKWAFFHTSNVHYPGIHFYYRVPENKHLFGNTILSYGARNKPRVWVYI
jgi:hypothetical protein